MNKILIADDSPVAAKMQATILEKQGYAVAIARDGIEAAQAVYTEQPNLVLLDIFMPRMNGYQVCRLLKHDPTVSDIPIIINTASDAREAEFWSLHTGADAFLLKGSSPTEMLGVIERLLRERPSRAASRSSPAPHAPGPEEILSKVSALADQELYSTTVQRVHLHTILENLCEGILTLDGAGRVASANRFLCRLLGATESELAGCDLNQALGGEAGAHTDEMFRAAVAGGEVAPRDGEVRDRAGQITPVSINVAAVRDHVGEIVGCVALFQDITRRKQVEALSQLKNDLTAMIVHDLRTPLTSLLTGLESLDFLGEISDLHQEILNISMDGGQTLLRMINDLLDISKMEDGSLQLERRELNTETLAANALRQVASLATSKELTLSHEVAPGAEMFWGDDDKLLRSIVNLLSNAVKFTPQNGSVTLSVQPAPATHGDTSNHGANSESSDASSDALDGKADNATGVLVSVRDTGEGIPESAFERIFEKFGQVEGRKSGRTMSTGLGLTFCKMAVEAHGGRIWVQSVPGEGSTFSFVLPHRTSAAAHIEAHLVAANSRDRRIRCIVPLPHPERRIGPHDQRNPTRD